MNRARNTAIVALTAFAVLATVSTTAEAQHRRHRARGHGHVSVAFMPAGMYVGAGFVGTRILSQDGGDELLKDGIGLSLYTGIRLNQRLALEAGIASTFHNPERVQTSYGDDVDWLVLNAGTVDAKVFFPGSNAKVTPYAQGGLGLYLLDSDYLGTQSVGSGFQLGGGVQFDLGPGIALGVRALYRGISMGPPESDRDNTFISAFSAEGNLSLRF